MQLREHRGRRDRRADLEPAALAVAGLAGCTRRWRLLAGAAGLLARTARPLGALLLVGRGGGAVARGGDARPAGDRLLARRRDHRGAAAGAHGGAGGRRSGSGRPGAGRGAMTGLLAVVLGLAAARAGPAGRRRALVGARAVRRAAVPARVAVALLVALGAGLVVGGIAAVRRFREAGRCPGTTRTGRCPSADRRSRHGRLSRLGGHGQQRAGQSSALARSRSVSKSTSTAANAEMSSGRKRRPSSSIAVSMARSK